MSKPTIASLTAELERVTAELEQARDKADKETAAREKAGQAAQASAEARADAELKEKAAAKQVELLGERITAKDQAIAELNTQLESAGDAAVEPMRFWSRLCSTPPEALKAFNKGGFKGKSIDPMYRFEMLTRVFGPCGIGWGFEITDIFDRTFNEQPFVFVRGSLWYTEPSTGEKHSTAEQIGGTQATHNPDEAYKMAVTDAATKCATLLGLAADVFRGLHDGDKYQAGAPSKGKPKQPSQQKARKESGKPTTDQTAAVIEQIGQAQSRDQLKPLWATFSGWKKAGVLEAAEAKVIVDIFKRRAVQIDQAAEAAAERDAIQGEAY